jgi:hypothetical protein
VAQPLDLIKIQAGNLGNSKNRPYSGTPRSELTSIGTARHRFPNEQRVAIDLAVTPIYSRHMARATGGSAEKRARRMHTILMISSRTGDHSELWSSHVVKGGIFRRSMVAYGKPSLEPRRRRSDRRPRMREQWRKPFKSSNRTCPVNYYRMVIYLAFDLKMWHVVCVPEFLRKAGLPAE